MQQINRYSTPGAKALGSASSAAMGMWRAGVGLAANSSAVLTSMSSKPVLRRVLERGESHFDVAAPRPADHGSGHSRGATHSARRGALILVLEKFMKSMQQELAVELARDVRAESSA